MTQHVLRILPGEVIPLEPGLDSSTVPHAISPPADVWIMPEKIVESPYF